MGSRLGHTILGAMTLVLISVSTIILTLIIFVLALLKFVSPTPGIRHFFRKLLTGVAVTWISINNSLLSLIRATRWDIQIPEGLDRKGCYLVNSNHQSWVDILALQKCFNRRLPFLRFFLKSQLIWVPFLGVAWWALDFPFMHRLSRAKLAKNPGLKGKDLENARKACEKFRDIPVAMMNFPEGTRFSEEKRAKSGSQYQNLLIPRIGGTGQVLYSLGEQLDSLVDVTIVYPVKSEKRSTPTFWQLITRQIPEIVVRAEQIEIPKDLLGRSFRSDREFRGELEAWMNVMWEDKDRQLSELLKS